MEEESKKIVEDMKHAREEVSSLKDKLTELNTEKEAWFSKKAEISESIKKNIVLIKELKDKRNEYTNKVKELKKERDVMNSEITTNIKKIVTEKKDAGITKESYSDNPRDRRKSPSRIKAEMDKLEFRLETQPMSFDKEQKIRKEIRDMKKEYDELKGKNKLSDEVKVMSSQTNSLKKKANTVHKEIQKYAKESQDAHEALIAKSNEVDELKKKEEEAYNKFLELKTEFSKLSGELQEKSKDFHESKQKIDSVGREAAKKKHQEEQEVMREKTKEVEEKISKRKKLTTEDLLVMQRGN
ncbi:MAG: coiled-coil protein [Candidatus Nanoarchaeia archaeon]